MTLLSANQNAYIFRANDNDYYIAMTYFTQVNSRLKRPYLCNDYYYYYFYYIEYFNRIYTIQY